jgi:hypothetical protein
LLSVGALALSVVAMTTMFVFVYSHGSGALEAAAKMSSRAPGRAVAEAHASAASPGTSNEPSAPVVSPFAGNPAADRCVAPSGPLHPASLFDFSDEDESGIRVERHSLTPRLGARAIECE